jgi:hypothetical protein
MRKRKQGPPSELSAANVIALRQRILPRHCALLARWIEAGQRMGLCDASAFFSEPGERQQDYVLVWVRENADPAYMVAPDGFGWLVTDTLRQQPLAKLGSFEAALNFIRPVLTLVAAA